MLYDIVTFCNDSLTILSGVAVGFSADVILAAIFKQASANRHFEGLHLRADVLVLIE